MRSIEHVDDDVLISRGYVAFALRLFGLLALILGGVLTSWHLQDPTFRADPFSVGMTAGAFVIGLSCLLYRQRTILDLRARTITVERLMWPLRWHSRYSALGCRAAAVTSEARTLYKDVFVIKLLFCAIPSETALLKDRFWYNRCSATLVGGIIGILLERAFRGMMRRMTAPQNGAPKSSVVVDHESRGFRNPTSDWIEVGSFLDSPQALTTARTLAQRLDVHVADATGDSVVVDKT